MDLISIITPCYNQGQYLAEAIESVIAQTYTNWECIIVNDGSTDNCEEVAANLIKKDERISYYRKDNGGLSSARNFGIQKSRGNLIFPLDADDKIHATYLEKAVKVFQDAKVKVVYCELMFFGAKQGVFELPEYSRKGLATMNMIVGNSFFRKQDFIAAGGYNANMIYGWEDWNLWVSILKNGGNVFKIPEVLFYYRIKAGSMLASLEGARKQKMFMQLYLNHPEFFDEYHNEPVEIFPQFTNLKDYNKVLLEHIDFLKGLLKLNPFSYLELMKKIRKRLLK